MALTDKQRENAEERLESLIETIAGKPLAWYSAEGASKLKTINELEAKLEKELTTAEALAKEPDLPDWLDAVPEENRQKASQLMSLEANWWIHDEAWYGTDEATLALETMNITRKELGWPSLDFMFNEASEETDEDPTDGPGFAYGIELDNLSDTDYAATLANCPKVHELLPVSTGKRNNVGLRYDHRFDDCAYLSPREAHGMCTVNRKACPMLGGRQQECDKYAKFAPPSENPKGPGVSKYVGHPRED
jgi:hypothetical protein